ncbi:TPA: hypothetical protein ACGW7H_005814 [Bacillus nitratireducens]
MGWYSSYEVKDKPHIGAEYKHNWHDDLDSMLLLSETDCRKGGAPVLEGEKPVAYIYCAMKKSCDKYYGVYDRTGRIKMFERKELGGFYMASNMVWEVSKLYKLPRKLKRVGFWAYQYGEKETVYDLSEYMESPLPLLPELFDDELGLIARGYGERYGLNSDRFDDEDVKILGFALTKYGYGIHAVFDVSKTREYKAWRLQNLFN